MKRHLFPGFIAKLLIHRIVLLLRLNVPGNMGEEFADDWWINALNRIYTNLICAWLAIIQFKIFHSVHCSKARLSAIYSNVDDSCDKCRMSPCNQSHMFFFLSSAS